MRSCILPHGRFGRFGLPLYSQAGIC